MTREIVVVLLGVCVLLLPYLGVPQTMRDTLLGICGVLIMVLGASLRHARYRRSITHHHGELHGTSFAESARKATSVAPAAPTPQRAAPAIHAAKIRATIATSSSPHV